MMFRYVWRVEIARKDKTSKVEYLDECDTPSLFDARALVYARFAPTSDEMMSIELLAVVPCLR